MNRVWIALGRILGSLMLFGGGAVLLGLGLVLAIAQSATWSVALLLSLMVFLGLLPMTLGGWMVYASAKARQQSIQDSFYQVLHRKQGRIALLEFAAAARLEPAKARTYLDRWAGDCDAEFDVSDKGEIFYVFSNEPLALAGEPVWRTWLGRPLAK